jgi:hypothetical protein
VRRFQRSGVLGGVVRAGGKGFREIEIEGHGWRGWQSQLRGSGNGAK